MRIAPFLGAIRPRPPGRPRMGRARFFPAPAQAAALAFIALGLLSTHRLQACYSGLILIPTTDVTGAYTFALDLQYESSGSAFRTEGLLVNTEFGVGDRIEVGVDFDLHRDAEHRVLLNGKWTFLRSETHRLAAAVGFANMDPRFHPFPYLVLSKDFGLLRVHAGVQHEDEGNHNNAFVGVDRIFESGWQIMADHSQGDSNFTSVGAGRAGKAWGLYLGAQWPNAGGPGRAVVHLTWTTPLRKTG